MKIKIQRTELLVQVIMLGFALLVGLSLKAQYNYLGSYDSQGKPNYLEAIRDQVSQAFLNDVTVSLPESRPVPTYNPHYIASGTETDICLKDSADVWVTFVAEGAGYRNVLGFYTYDLANPPQSTDDINQETIIFPNVSALGSGGSLLAGDKVKIGTFSPNTGIGWFLIANGWSGNAVGSGNWKVYSNPDFNPETQAAERFHNVLLNDPTNERIVLGFEDIRRDYASCDQDFNDAIFYITANPYTAIQTDSINTIADATTTVSSGGNGGLESNGELALKIAQRNFRRKKTKTLDYNSIENLPVFSKAEVQKGTIKSFKKDKGTDQQIHELLPMQSLFNSTAVISTPNDLVDLTNASEVFAADYISEGSRKGAALVIYTKNKVYEHTKAVCDRLNGAELLSIKKVSIQGKDFALFKLKQADGAIEYAINFVVQNNGDQTYTVENQWALHDYLPANNNYNFQCWSSTTAMTIQLVEEILAKMANRGILNFTPQSVEIPSVYIRKGAYKHGKLLLTIQNNVQAGQLILKGNLSRTETGFREPIQQTISLNGSMEETLELEVGHLFDIGFSLEAPGFSVADVLYTADGAWGTDYVSAGATLFDYNIYENPTSVKPDCYSLERELSSSGTVKDYISFFKSLKAGNKSVDLSRYNAIQFEGFNNREMEITLVKESIQNWEDQFRIKLKPSIKDGKTVVFFADLKSTNQSIFVADDVQSVVFSIKNDGEEETQHFDLNIRQLEFIQEKYLSAIVQNELTIFPNPVSSNTLAVIRLQQAGQAVAKVVALNGKTVFTQTKQLKEGTNQCPFPQNLKAGIYFYTLSVNEQLYYRKFIVQ